MNPNSKRRRHRLMGWYGASWKTSAIGLIVSGAACLLGTAGKAAADSSPADTAMREGADATARADYNLATGRFQQAAALYAAAGQTGRQIDALVRYADVARATGHATSAIETLFTNENLQMEHSAAGHFVETLAKGDAPDHAAVATMPAMLGMHMDVPAPGQAPASVQDAYMRANPNAALTLALRAGDGARIMEVEASIGVAAMFSEDADAAEPFLKDALRRAEALKETRSIESIDNAMATLYAGRRSAPERIADPLDREEALANYTKAIALYDQVIHAAAPAGMPELAAKATANKGVAADHNYQYADAVRFDADALPLVSGLPDSYAKANLLMTLGQSDFHALTNDPALQNDTAAGNKLLARAYGLYQQALAIGQQINSPMTVSYALGYTAELYEQQKRMDEALVLTRRALFLAQQAQASDAIWRWEWQTGRILRAQGDADGAMAAYIRAEDTVFRKNSNLSNDIGLAYGNQNMRSSFRERVGPLLFGLADLLLRDADKHPAGSVEEQSDLKEARATIEKLKQAELEDYLQDKCASLYQQQQQDIDSLARQLQVALVYFIPLPDRTELLVTLPDKIHRYQVPVADVQLTKVVRRFRTNLEDRSTNEYITQARQLYGWLIAPMEADLQAQKIGTLVFVPDGSLRTIPMAALREPKAGGKFLVQKYDIAISPGLKLMEIRSVSHKDIDVFSSGMTQAKMVGGVQFAALPHVKDELKDIRSIFGTTGTELIDSNFTYQGVSDDVRDPKVTVVHMATHGVFSGDSKKTFLVTFDKNIDLSDLQMLIAPKKYAGQSKPVELLTLSACQTAKGDDRAALGLAGVAIKAGARSAYATLWSVNDEASARLIETFYRQLHDHPDITKAEALRRAQESLLNDPKYSHPYFWSPSLIIGNWL